MPGELHAMIGPNGAGKTTLINQISGLLAPDAGRIVFAGRRRDRACRCTRARAARARALVPDHLDPAALLRAGERRARRAGARRLELPVLRPRRSRGRAERAGAGGARAGRSRRARARAAPANSSHGEKRALELAIALAMQPKLLLLDEPMAGTGREETERLVAVLRRLKGRFPDGAGRARHDRGVRARRPHLGADLRPHPRERHARRRCAPTRRWSPPISARRWSEHAERRAISRPATARRRCCSTSSFASARARS